MIRIKSIKKKWQQINYRKVNNLMSAEFLHDLYNRHDPQINSIRFRNTLVIKKGEEVKTYAPKVEWESMTKWLSEKFLVHDEQTVKYTNELIKYPRNRLVAFIKEIESTDLLNISNKELILNLIDIHYIVLGEIYKVNLVQIEKSLNFAIKSQLKKFFKEELKLNEVLSIVIFSDVETFGVKNKREMYELVIQMQETGKFDRSKVKTFYEANKYKFTAYGADLEKYEEYLSKVEELFKIDIAVNLKYLENLILFQKNSLSLKEEYLSEIKSDSKLMKNIDLLERLGVRRDRNKTLMGTTNLYKDKIFDEISKRTNVPIVELQNYLLSEIIELIENSTKLDLEEIEKRRKYVCFRRIEYMGFEEIDKSEFWNLDENDSNSLKGICASRGEAVGFVRIIKGSEDVSRMKKGDIMVAPGTDFDVINAMQIAGAIITEEGGILSHASVVSRELKIPCVIGVTDCTSILKEGQQISVNATKGIINLKCSEL